MTTDPAETVRRRGIAAAQRAGTMLGFTDDSDFRTLYDSCRVTYELAAPLVVRIADDMLADLRADAASRGPVRVLALGRDGHSLAIAMSKLDRHFYRQHVSNLPLSRAVVENALQDLERHQGLKFPQVQGYRRVAPRVDPADTIGGFRALSDFLQRHKVPAGGRGAG